ncbi:MAG: hypothetical protein AB4426_35745 [Xenococcaceae cyanobacterium]
MSSILLLPFKQQIYSCILPVSGKTNQSLSPSTLLPVFRASQNLPIKCVAAYPWGQLPASSLVPLRGSQKAKGLHAKVLIGKALMIFALMGYFCRAALGGMLLAKSPSKF